MDETSMVEINLIHLLACGILERRIGTIFFLDVGADQQRYIRS